MFPDKLKKIYYQSLRPLVFFFTLVNIHPLVLTITGFVLSAAAAYFFLQGAFLWAGLVLLAGGVFDSIDGQVARETNRTSDFGAFFDSVTDRFSEIIVLAGIIMYYIDFYPVAALVTLAFLLSSLMVSYTKARGEGLGTLCDIGIMQRPERVFLLGLAALCGEPVLILALWVLAMVTVLTVFQRIYFIGKKLL
jgi:CDP-diacylglycerol--glycerol-3-phosphate 3-phosphatidyltransferase